MSCALSICTPKCRICDEKPTNGQHFGVLACRACAAFFRRSVLSDTAFHCDKKNCELIGSAKRRLRCKKCRLEKCLKMGMDRTKIQLERDVLSTASNFQSSRKQTPLPRSMASFLGRPASILCCEPDKASHVKLIIDLSPMISRVELVLRQASTHSDSPVINSLQVLTEGFRKMRSKPPNPKLTMARVINKELTLRTWEENFIDTATWLSEFGEFRALPEKIRMTIIKSGWLVWSKLEQFARTAEYRKRQLCSEGVLVGRNDDVALDLSAMEWDIKWMTNYTKEQLITLMPLDIENIYETVVKCLMELDPSETELNYMLCHICLFMAAKRHPHIATVTERLLDVQADNLHDYYQKTLASSSYSLRIAKMMRINNLLMRDALLRRERSRVVDVLNLMCYAFSDDEMFV